MGLGIALLAGKELTVRLPHLDRGGQSRELSSMLLFGISYAVASLSCTLPAFLATTSSTFNRSGTLAGLATFIAYGLGMGLIVGVLTLAVALARVGLVRTLRGMRATSAGSSGALVLVAGLYIAYYGVYEVRLGRLGPGDSPADPVIDRALRIQQALSDWIGDVGTRPAGGGVRAAGGRSAWRVAWGLRRNRAGGDALRCWPACCRIPACGRTWRCAPASASSPSTAAPSSGPPTSIATAAAERAGASYYGLVQPPELRWHIPSNRVDPAFSEPLAAFLDHVDVAIAVHGFGRAGYFTTLLLGGRNRVLAGHLGAVLRRRIPHYQVLDDLDDVPVDLRGLHADNPVNRPRQAGVQLELPPRVRGMGPYWYGWDPARPLTPHTEALIEALAEAAVSWSTAEPDRSPAR